MHTITRTKQIETIRSNLGLNIPSNKFKNFGSDFGIFIDILYQCRIINNKLKIPSVFIMHDIIEASHQIKNSTLKFNKKIFFKFAKAKNYNLTRNFRAFITLNSVSDIKKYRYSSQDKYTEKLDSDSETVSETDISDIVLAKNHQKFRSTTISTLLNFTNQINSSGVIVLLDSPEIIHTLLKNTDKMILGVIGHSKVQSHTDILKNICQMSLYINNLHNKKYYNAISMAFFDFSSYNGNNKCRLMNTKEFFDFKLPSNNSIFGINFCVNGNDSLQFKNSIIGYGKKNDYNVELIVEYSCDNLESNFSTNTAFFKVTKIT